MIQGLLKRRSSPSRRLNESMQNRGGWSSLGYITGSQKGERGVEAGVLVKLEVELLHPAW
jgi:hypothetical protein